MSSLEVKILPPLTTSLFFLSVFDIERIFIYLFSISTISPSLSAINLQQTVAINRRTNDVLSKTDEKSTLFSTIQENNSANKSKMSESQSDGLA